jgi:hypothetical protein
VAIVYVKLDLWNDEPSKWDNIGGIILRCLFFMYLLILATCLIPSLTFIEYLDTSVVFRWLFGSLT